MILDQRFLARAFVASLCLTLVCLPSRTLAEPGRQQSSTQTETIEVDPSAPSHPFPHYWEKMFGSGRAILSLRDSYRRDLRQVEAGHGF